MPASNKMILSINSGSSSVKVAAFDRDSGQRIIDLRVTGIGEPAPILKDQDQSLGVTAENHEQALKLIFDRFFEHSFSPSDISAVGHRIVHGGETLISPALINEKVEKTIEAAFGLAPLHNPMCLAAVKIARSILDHCPHVAIFDTGFHATLPTRAKLYALPERLVSKHNIRRFGFHGISHEYVSQAAADALHQPLENLRIISCHLGNGCSVTAVENGRSVETSMGMTPLEGLVMGSRSGDLDPGVLIRIARAENKSADDLNKLLNHESGLVGMTGSNDMYEIERRAASGDEACRRAIQVFTHRVRKYIGAYAAIMGGVDAIVFTGGIGENSATIRHRIAQRLDFLGAVVDEELNRQAKVNNQEPVANISSPYCPTRLLVVATDEEVAMANIVNLMLYGPSMETSQLPIPVSVSARHIHLTDEAVFALFGNGHRLTPDHDLSQPGEFAARETLTVIGPCDRIEGVRIVGPTRAKNQLEISRSDEFFLGIDAPVRASGDTDNTPGITLVGPAGNLTLQSGVICALRHIHMHPDDADKFEVNDGELVSVKIRGGPRDLTFGEVLIRVSDNFKLEMHIDTDEANAAELAPGYSATLIQGSRT